MTPRISFTITTMCSMFILTLTSGAHGAQPNALTTPVNCYDLSSSAQCTQSYQEFCMNYDTADNSTTGCNHWGLIQCKWVENKEGNNVATWCVPLGKQYAMNK